jgi:hypothetical protein
MTYLCPVCGYDSLSDPPEAYMICPCCGTEFENDDEDLTHAELRQQWIAKSMAWWSPNTLPPPAWDPEKQLVRAGHSPVASGKHTSPPLRLKVPVAQ